MDTEKRRVFLIRHGETDYNAERRIQGRAGDCPLNKRGETQAALTALALKKYGFQGDCILTSPLERARQTASFIKDYFTKPRPFTTVFHHDLKEMDYGDWEGVTFSETVTRFPAEREIWINRPTDKFKFNGAEISFGQVKKRVINVYEEHVKAWLEYDPPIPDKDLNKDLIVVGHGVVNRIILFHILKMPFNRWPLVRQDNCCINIISYASVWDGIPLEKFKATVELINGCEHLL